MNLMLSHFVIVTILVVENLAWLGAAEHLTKMIHKSGKENYF